MAHEFTLISVRRRVNIKAFKAAADDVLRFLVRLAANMPRERSLATVRAVAKSTGAEARNPKWTSYDALELDVFCPSKADFDLFTSAVRPLASLEFARDPNVAPPYRTEEDLLREAREMFNSERYWECHEVLEGLWRQKKGEEKRLLQGMILVCAAFVHHQKGEEDVALGVMRRAADQLEYASDSYGGFDVLGMKRNVQNLLKARRLSVFRV